MSAPSRRTFVNAAVILGVGLCALGGVSLIPPLRDLEREMVKEISLRLDPAESAFSGNGSQEKPWRRWKAKPAVVPDSVRLLSIDDDPEGWYSSSPPSPVDCALIFARLREAGHTTVGCGYLMAWEEAEPLAVLALRKQLDRLDAAVLGLPLARGAAAEPLPAAFLRLSIDAGEVDGDSSSLPQVNRVAVPDAELGGERTLAGFTLLENERDAGEGRRHVLARWDDRIIFSLPLATEIAALKIDPAEIRILAGKEIRLGVGGPVIPIDEFGRTPITPDTPQVDTPAWKLVAEDNPVPPTQDPLLIRDHRSELPEADRAWSDALGGLAHALRAAPRYEESVVLPRPEALAEIGLLGLIAFFATWAASMDRFGWRLLAVLMAAALSAELVYLFAARQNLWLPPFAVSIMAVTSIALAFIPEGRAFPAVEAAPEPVPTLAPEAPAPEPAPAVEVPLPEPIPEIEIPPAPAPAPASVATPVEIPEPAFVSVYILKTPEGLIRVKVSPRAPVPEAELPEPSSVAADPQPEATPKPQPASPPPGKSSYKSSKKSRRKRRR